jgi:hypothetical protein
MSVREGQKLGVSSSVSVRAKCLLSHTYSEVCRLGYSLWSLAGRYIDPIVLSCFLVLYFLPSILCVVFFIVSPNVYGRLFSICVKFYRHCHRVEIQLQLINITHSPPPHIPTCRSSLILLLQQGNTNSSTWKTPQLRYYFQIVHGPP